MEWHIEQRASLHYDWARSAHSVPIGYDEIKVKAFLLFLRMQYPMFEFRVLKVLSW